jgi:hypothetical protein
MTRRGITCADQPLHSIQRPRAPGAAVQLSMQWRQRDNPQDHLSTQ